MPDALTAVTNLINSPPGQLVAGGVLAGIVWKFFERVEAVLNEDTKNRRLKTSVPGPSLTPELLVRRSLPWDHTGKLCPAPPYYWS
jgi:hypothetical protein